MADQVSVTEHIDASADAVYALVSDLPRMGEWSPENTGGSWAGGATGAAVGARFKGTNKNESKRWATTCKVVEATPGSSFVFDVGVGPLKIARWGYRIVPAASGGVDVTETWTDQRSSLMKPLGKVASGVADRKTHNEASMRTTLANLKAAAEAS
jgi:hypothetical protein